MEKTQIIKYAVIALVIFAVIVAGWEFVNREAKFCRTVLRGLVMGSPKIDKDIDWEQLKATGLDIGSTYRRITTDSDKALYRRLFIRNFAVGFKVAKGNFGKFRNWRVLERKGSKVVVGADYLLYNKTILFTVKKIPKMKIIAIEWKE